MEHRGDILSESSDGTRRPMTESFYEAFINCRHRVLGRNLKPFSNKPAMPKSSWRFRRKTRARQNTERRTNLPKSKSRQRNGGSKSRSQTTTIRRLQKSAEADSSPPATTSPQNNFPNPNASRNCSKR